MMKRICLLLIGVLALFASVHAQSLKGKVIDETNAPLAYANVILQTSDSIYVAGTTTNLNGLFDIAVHEQAKLISISFVGYSTVVQTIQADDLGVIQLLPDAQLLAEVQVKGYLPKTQAKGDAMVTQVSGTLLEKAGTAENLLNKIPNVTSQDGSVTVFGRGTPEIYINGRKMRNPQELDRLSSDDIQSVEVVSNPGARYDASVKAVIRLITKKKAGEGFGLNNRAVARYREKYGWTTFDQLDMNYRKNGLDVSTMLYAGNLMNGSAQTFVIDTYLDKQWQQTMDLSDQKAKTQELQAVLSVNYQFDENHTLGALYEYIRTPKDEGYINQFAQTFCDGQLYENLHSMLTENEPGSSRRSNLYYNGKIKGWSIDFNADALWTDTKNKQTAQENVSGSVNHHADRTVTTHDTKRNELYAAKLVVSHPVAKGELSLGAEYSHNKRNTTYFNAEGIIGNDEAMIKEGATSAFVEYVKKFNNLQMQAGLRYEHVGFNYYDAGKWVAEQSKTYHNVFPSITFSFPLKDIQMQLGYASDIQRPSYRELRSNTMYVNRYMYDKGNPFLMPSISHNVNLGASYKWVNLYLSYSHVEDDIADHITAFSDDDPTIALLTLCNGPEYDKFLASVSFSPTIGLWTPQLGLGIQKQWYEGETPSGKKMFGKPLGSLSFRNNFKLPAGLLLGLDAIFVTKGYDENVYVADERLDLNASLYKSFLKDNLTLQLNADHLLASKQVVDVYSGIRVMNNTQAFYRSFTLTLRYKFNSTKSKYKGTGAGQSQKSRM